MYNYIKKYFRGFYDNCNSFFWKYFRNINFTNAFNIKKKHSLKQNYKVSLKGQKNKLKFITKFPRGHRSWSSFITFATFASFYVK